MENLTNSPIPRGDQVVSRTLSLGEHTLGTPRYAARCQYPFHWRDTGADMAASTIMTN